MTEVVSRFKKLKGKTADIVSQRNIAQEKVAELEKQCSQMEAKHNEALQKNAATHANEDIAQLQHENQNLKGEINALLEKNSKHAGIADELQTMQQSSVE